LGEVEPKELTDVRLQLHWAVQPVMAFADCALERRDDDSQSNLGWRDDLDALVGRQRPDGLAAGLRVPDMTLLVIDRGGIAYGRSLEGLTIAEVVSWLEEKAVTLTGRQFQDPIRIRGYDMPAHPVATGARFTIEQGRAIADLGRWFGNGNLALNELVSTGEGWSEVRCWPHHFDLGTLVALGPSGRSIGAGMSPGDGWYEEPYFYVNPYGLAEVPATPPSLPSGGHWHVEGWFGAVLTATALLAVREDAQQSALTSFLREAVAGARDLQR